MSKVVLKDLVKIYPNGFKAVHSINLEVKEGEFMVFVGPSGCSKSTILRMIAGLEEVSSGTISIAERVVNDVSPKDRSIAMVFQNYALYPHMSVRENISFGLKMRKVEKREIERRVLMAAKNLEIEDLLERKPKEISGGQRQRVALGRAIVRDPKVFLFDEPLSNLDAKLRVSMRVKIQELHKELGATMIYVTHDQVEAMTMGDRICILKDGRICQVDNPINLYNSPNSIFVASFIGSPSMNLAEFKIEADKLVYSGTKATLKMNRDLKSKLRSYNGESVIVGIRAEDILLVSEEKADFKGEVKVVENMGSEMFVYFYIEGSSDIWIFRTQDFSHKFNMADEVFLKVDLSKIHLFNSKTELRI